MHVYLQKNREIQLHSTKSKNVNFCTGCVTFGNLKHDLKIQTKIHEKRKNYIYPTEKYQVNIITVSLVKYFAILEKNISSENLLRVWILKGDKDCS